TQLTDLELYKARFVRHVSQYLSDPSSRSWEELRGELTAQLLRTQEVFHALDSQADFKSAVPQAARSLIIALDEKSELLQTLRGIPKPANADDLEKLRQLRQALDAELGPIEAAHDGFAKYMEPRPT